MSNFKRRDGFVGQRMIEVPRQVLQKAILQHPLLARLHITQIGYFPKAFHHYRERRNGCADNILFYCMQGKGWYMIDKQYFEVQANEYVILPATSKYVRYGADENDPWTIYWVHYTGTTIEEMNNSLGITPDKGPTSIAYNKAGIQTWEIMFESLEKKLLNDNLFNANLCLYKFVASFLYNDKWQQKPVTQRSIFLNAAKTHMLAHIDKKLTVPEMAAKQGISVSYFSQQFRKATGIAPLDYFTQLKMQHSSQLLLNTDIKVKDVAVQVGIDDPYYFSRLFKKYMLLSPEQYRIKKWKEADAENVTMMSV